MVDKLRHCSLHTSGIQTPRQSSSLKFQVPHATRDYGKRLLAECFRVRQGQFYGLNNCQAWFQCAHLLLEGLRELKETPDLRN